MNGGCVICRVIVQRLRQGDLCNHYGRQMGVGAISLLKRAARSDY